MYFRVPGKRVSRAVFFEEMRMPTYQNINEFVRGDLTSMSIIPTSNLMRTRTSSRIMTSQLCILSTGKSMSKGEYEIKKTLHTAREDRTYRLVVCLCQFDRRVQLDPVDQQEHLYHRVIHTVI